MAKISNTLQDIEKLVKKSSQTPKEQLKEINKQLETFNLTTNLSSLYYVGSDKLKYKQLEAVETLKQARTILLEQIEQEEDKNELQKKRKEKAVINEIKEEIKAELFSNLNGYFEEFKPEHHQLVYQALHVKEAIDDEIQKITDIYGLEFKDYTLSIYIATVEKVYAIYKYNVKQQEEQKKAEEQRKKKLKKELSHKLKKGIASDLFIIGLLKYCSKGKRR